MYNVTLGVLKSPWYSHVVHATNVSCTMWLNICIYTCVYHAQCDASHVVHDANVSCTMWLYIYIYMYMYISFTTWLYCAWCKCIVHNVTNIYICIYSLQRDCIVHDTNVSCTMWLNIYVYVYIMHNVTLVTLCMMQMYRAQCDSIYIYIYVYILYNVTILCMMQMYRAQCD